MTRINCEIESKFQVPSSSRAAVLAEMGKGASLDRMTLAARYLDTPDRRLAQAGIAWRLRREGRRWVQTLKATGATSLERYEHEVIRPAATHDARLHAGTPAGDRLNAILSRARTEGIEPAVRFRTEVRRLVRRIRTRGAVVEVAFDEGSILAGRRSQRIRELEFELLSGPATAMLALAERWRKRLGLMLDPRTKAERGDRLAEGLAFPPVRRASRSDYAKTASPVDAFGTVLDDCLSQITHNAIGICDGDPKQRIEHVHQMRVGIRRLRSAIRSFEDWVGLPPPQHLIDDLRILFAALGDARDIDVLDSGVGVALTEAGAPAIRARSSGTAVDTGAIVRAADVQRLLLEWVAWRVQVAESPVRVDMPGSAIPAEHTVSPVQVASGSHSAQEPLPDHDNSRPQTLDTPSETQMPNQAFAAEIDFPSSARKRLAKWQGRIAAEIEKFGSLDNVGLHALRKRIKRQRYAVEFFAPLLRRRRVKAYLKPLAEVQERMGELNELLVARSHYEALAIKDPAAWFALGWLAARVNELRMATKRALQHLLEAHVP